jgi:hypothetical protein
MFRRRKEAGRFFAKPGIPKLAFSQASLKREAVSAPGGLDIFLQDLTDPSLGCRPVCSPTVGSQVWCSRRCLEIYFFFWRDTILE